jgi:outer membrane protein TolC
MIGKTSLFCFSFRRSGRVRAAGWVLLALLPACGVPLYGQSAAAGAVARTVEGGVAARPAEITLSEAIRRAQANAPEFAAARAESRTAGLERWTAWSGLLPGAVYHNSGTYSQGAAQKSSSASSDGAPRFIAANGVHEYTSQAVISETVGVAAVAQARRADATAARAAAELEVARRGLTAAVTGLYFGVAAAQNKLLIAERARAEAADFLSLTGRREAAREAAHADVVKAQLVAQQRERELSDARLAAEKSRLELGVLLFPDPRTPYSVVAEEAAPLPARAEVDAQAAAGNPELKSAQAAMAESNADVLAARAAYLPEINFNYSYGIDAAQFAVNAPDHTSNLGHAAGVTVDLPVWDWLSTGRKVRQSEIRRQAVRTALTATQRRLIARLDEAYAEAAAAREQLASLDESVTTAAESLRLTRLRYSEGEATVFEVVDAESSFVSAENAREDGRVRSRTARADLQTLTGSM